MPADVVGALLFLEDYVRYTKLPRRVSHRERTMGRPFCKQMVLGVALDSEGVKSSSSFTVDASEALATALPHSSRMFLPSPPR